MPNWVSTVFRVDGNDKDAFLDAVRLGAEGRKNVLFCNQFVPRPKTYENYDTTNYSAISGAIGHKLHIGDKLPSYGAVRTKSGKVTKKYLDAFAKAETRQRERYGAVGWYDWACKYWGTKWDVTDFHMDGNAVEFCTAWSFPEPVFKVIARRYDVKIDGSFDGEDFHGYFYIRNRELRVEYLDGSGENDIHIF